MQKTYIQKSRRIFNGKKGQANPNPGSFTTLALKDSLKSLFTGNNDENHETQGLWIIVLPILLWIADLYFGINGIEWNTLLDTFKLQGFDFFLNLIWRSAFPAIVVLYFIFSKPKNRQEVAYSLVLIFLFFTVWTIGKANIWITYHLLFAAIVYIFFLKGLSNGVTQAHKGFLLVMIFDLFAFPSLSFIGGNVLEVEFIKLLSNKLLFPIWIFYIFIFIKESTLKSIAKAIIWFAYIGYFGFTNISVYGDLLQQTSGQQIQAVKDAPGKIVKNYLGFFSTWLKGQVQYAITGKVEKNQYEPLGVYLDNVKSADPKYYENEDVVIWGTVRARTLDDPINVRLGCYVKDGTKKTETKDVDPPTAFPVFKLEEQDFACTFKKDFSNILKSGSNTITAFADFNFETLAFLKIYFIDRERLRAMTRENLDPFTEFGIKDKKPITIYTNGPAAIGMETTSPLIGVGESYITFPRLSMSIQNNQGWQGRIKKFEEVILLLPKGVGLTDPQNDCGERKFSPYDIGQCQGSSCTKVNTECLGVCKDYKGSLDISNCEASCNEKLTSCQNDCNFLFQEEGQQYLGFSLDEKNLNEINDKLAKDDAPAGNFEFFRCKLSPKPEEVLQNSPITTKSIRAKIRYNYILEKPVSVRIDRLTDAERTTKIGDISTTPTTKLGKKVVETASQKGIPQSLAFALVSKESSFTHCCQESSQNAAGTCKKNDDPSCELKRLISSGSSYGIMQLNQNHCAWFSPQQVCQQGSIAGLNCFSGYQNRNSGGWKEECELFSQANCAPGQDATYIDCNIKLGLTYLKKLYDTNKNKIKTWECNQKTYTEWDLALRYYNGWGCQGADKDYVETINNIRQEILDKKAIQDLEEKPPVASYSQQTLIEER